MEFNIQINTLNEALKTLLYARAYQGPCAKPNEFFIEISTDKGGKYSDCERFEKLAKKEGYKRTNYFEHHDPIDGDFTYDLTFTSDCKVRCSYTQDKVYKCKED